MRAEAAQRYSPAAARSPVTIINQHSGRSLSAIGTLGTNRSYVACTYLKLVMRINKMDVSLNSLSTLTGVPISSPDRRTKKVSL